MTSFQSRENDATEFQEYLNKLSEIPHLCPQTSFVSSDDKEAQITIFDILKADEEEEDSCILSDIPIPLTRTQILADLEAGSLNRGSAILSLIFAERYRGSNTPVSFTKDDLQTAGEDLGIDLPKNLSDVIYALRHRSPIPEGIQRTALKGQDWVIETVGRSEYWLIQRPCQRIEADPSAFDYLFEDETPRIARDFGMKGAPLLDCILRKNQILKKFLGSPVEHLQSQVRASVKGVGQVEVGSLFFSDINGEVIPVCLIAKPGEFNLAKAAQNMRFAAAHYPEMDCRPVVAQLLSEKRVALFELSGSPETPHVLHEAHFSLAPRSE